jgi:beta-galactosidase GanA
VARYHDNTRTAHQKPCLIMENQPLYTQQRYSNYPIDTIGDRKTVFYKKHKSEQIKPGKLRPRG